MAVLDRSIFHLGDKKVVASHVRQVGILYSNSCLGIDSALVVLDKWLPHRGGCLSRFDCISCHPITFCGYNRFKVVSVVLVDETPENGHANSSTSKRCYKN